MKDNKKVILTAIITMLTLAFTFFILYKSGQEADFVINTSESQLEISGGFYGKTIEIDQDVEIFITEPLGIKRKSNGASLGNVKSGYFTLEDDVKVYLNLGQSTHDWIALIDGENRYYINLKDENDTLDLYNELLSLKDNH
jgi:hypothetical protein